MASAFDKVSPQTAASIRKELLAGHTMQEIRDGYIGADGRSSISARLMREMRDEVFDPLASDPDKVKALANGPVLNANEIIKYKRPMDRATRMARPRPVQIEMFPA